MQTFNIRQVIKKLIGHITPVGESHTDSKRYESLPIHLQLTDDLVKDIIDVAKMKDLQEYSIQRSGKEAHQFLCTLHQNIKDNIELESPVAYEYHNYDTSHAYVDYKARGDMDKNHGYTKTPLYK